LIERQRKNLQVEEQEEVKKKFNDKWLKRSEFKERISTLFEDKFIYDLIKKWRYTRNEIDKGL
jgi:hypothetical protein